eukprot:14587315-Ditylum_brightwellii.AAC.1
MKTNKVLAKATKNSVTPSDQKRMLSQILPIQMRWKKKILPMYSNKSGEMSCWMSFAIQFEK